MKYWVRTYIKNSRPLIETWITFHKDLFQDSFPEDSSPVSLFAKNFCSVLEWQGADSSKNEKDSPFLHFKKEKNIHFQL